MILSAMRQARCIEFRLLSWIDYDTVIWIRSGYFFLFFVCGNQGCVKNGAWRDDGRNGVLDELHNLRMNGVCVRLHFICLT
jgi:hypothetical protein